MNFPKKKIFLFSLILFVLMVSRGRSEALERGDERIRESIRVLEEIVNIPEEGVPEALLKNCHVIAVLPGVVKAAYGIGGQFGRGLILLKRDGVWSNPSFIRLVGGSFGWQIGVQKSDIILVFKSPDSVKDIIHGKITLGADVSVAAGPVGRHAEASTDLDFEAEIFSYAKSKGLFAGVSIKGASIQIDHDANREFYRDSGVSARDILMRDRVRAPRSAGRLKKVLESYTNSFRF